MTTLGRRSSALLFAGDIAAFAVSLFLTLWIRSGIVPSTHSLAPYLAPFAFLFTLWFLVFYGAGLYGKRIALFPSRLPDALLATQITNIVLAAIFFFVVPVGIAPKTILLLYLVVSLVLIFVWRLALYPRLSFPVRTERALLVAHSPEADALVTEVNSNPRYGLEFVCLPHTGARIDATLFLKAIDDCHPTILVVDTTYAEAKDIVPLIYRLTRIEHRFQFAAFEEVYEEVFDRIPLSQLEDAWFLEHTLAASRLYTAAKRGIDIVGGLVMFFVTLVAIPFVAFANRLEGPGPLFITQERFGRYGTRIQAYKFRSMRTSDTGMWPGEGDNRVTRVGSFLRQTSLDEFPQCLNILGGELSLIGPRNDLEALGNRLAAALPYYNARYLVKPGITGWAQVNQQYEPGNISPSSIEETKTRLAYDFYYLKHRSFGLDIVIALKTIKRMFFRLSSW